LAALPIVLYLTNTLSVATMIGLNEGLAPLVIWREAASLRELVLRALLCGLGLGAAATLVTAPWALPVVVLPGVALYLLLRGRRLRAEFTTGHQAAPLLVAQPVPVRAHSAMAASDVS